MKKQLVATITITTVLLFPPRATHAVSSTILQPNSVTGNFSSPIPSLINLDLMIDQSGLFPKYTNGDDFQTATEATHDGNANNITSMPGSSPVLLTFSFDKIYNIEGLAIWNDRFNSAIHNFNFYVDNNNNFDDDKTQLALFNENTSSVQELVTMERSASAPISPQIFTFSSTPTQFVHLNITRNFSGSLLTIPEVAFAQSAVPVPFEFGPISGIIFMATVAAANSFRNKKGQKRQVNGSKS